MSGFIALPALLELPSLSVYANIPGGDGGDGTGTDNTAPEYTVVVTASRLIQVLEDVPVSVTVIDQKELKAAGVKILADALRLGPGITVQSNGGRSATQQAFIRGSTSTQILVLLDGAPVASPQGALNLADVPVSMVERIEVVRGPGSALYGADAVGGVINIITTPASLQSGGNVQARIGGGEVEVLASHAGRIGRTDYAVTAGHVRSKGHRPNSDYEGEHLRVRIDQELSAFSEAYAQLSWMRGDSGVPGSTYFPTSPDAHQKDVQFRTEAGYTRELSNGMVRAMLYGRRYEREYKDFGTDEHLTTTWGVELQRDFDIDTGTLTVGVTARSDVANSTQLDGGKKSARSAALFGQLVRPLTERVAANLGARWDWHSAYPAPISPRAGVRIRVSPTGVLRLSAGRSFRAPTFDDLYWGGVGNPDLKPESGWSYEAGYRQNLSRGHLDVALFQRNTEDLIQWAEGADGMWRPYNVAQSRVRGADVTLSWKLTERLVLTNQWTLLDARDAVSGQRLPYVPRHEGRVIASYSQGDINAHLALQYRGDRKASTGESMLAYTVVNARLHRQLSPYLEVYVEGDNLLNVEYEETRGYPMPGRRLGVGAVLSF